MNKRTVIARQLAEFFEENSLVPENTTMKEYDSIESDLKPINRGRIITRALGSWSRAMKIVRTEMNKQSAKEKAAEKPAKAAEPTKPAKPATDPLAAFKNEGE
tara:strand:- start:178 stop:486 length:309 start_codon:yes stop_codon:yes gene_type:complete